ncbi:phage portal protein [Thioalkalivibrio sp. ALE6]|uniref:phage portal protein n=1 Tax=Thioalkalivibrio sp. ALE6 TaxID=1266908 RepID=UPI00035D2C17|nr:phage portal protein [Thioalkalivibrio sp. ALE6]
MGLVSRLFGRSRPAPPERTEPTVGARRNFDAAQMHRLVASWLGEHGTIDERLLNDLPTLRARARELAQNNDYVRRYLQMVVSNVVGASGFMLRALAEDAPGQPDREARKAVERGWYAYGRRGVCDATGHQSIEDMQRTVIEVTARDGESLTLMHTGPDAGNDWGLSLQLLDIDRLDSNLNRPAGGGRNAIIMGVEVDQRGRPVNYHLRPLNTLHAAHGHTVYPASQMIHLFARHSAEQHRGYPWAHTAMIRLHQLKAYEEAAVIAARIGASKMGFYYTPDGSAHALGDDKGNGEFQTTAEPGEFPVLPDGYQFQTFDPTYPHEQFENFVKAHLRGIASGLGVSYNSLANDLEGVSYSSIRVAVLEDRNHWMTLQNWFADGWLEPVFNTWIEMALASRKILLPSGRPLPAQGVEKFRRHEWQGRRWDWVDPKKDIEAAVDAIKAGLATPQDVAARAGLDLEDVIEAIAAANQLATDNNLPPYTDPPVTPDP